MVSINGQFIIIFYFGLGLLNNVRSADIVVKLNELSKDAGIEKKYLEKSLTNITEAAVSSSQNVVVGNPKNFIKHDEPATISSIFSSIKSDSFFGVSSSENSKNDDNRKFSTTTSFGKLIDENQISENEPTTLKYKSTTIKLPKILLVSSSSSASHTTTTTTTTNESEFPKNKFKKSEIFEKKEYGKKVLKNDSSPDDDDGLEFSNHTTEKGINSGTTEIIFKNNSFSKDQQPVSDLPKFDGNTVGTEEKEISGDKSSRTGKFSSRVWSTTYKYENDRGSVQNFNNYGNLVADSDDGQNFEDNNYIRNKLNQRRPQGFSITTESAIEAETLRKIVPSPAYPRYSTNSAMRRRIITTESGYPNYEISTFPNRNEILKMPSIKPMTSILPGRRRTTQSPQNYQNDQQQPLPTSSNVWALAAMKSNMDNRPHKRPLTSENFKKNATMTTMIDSGKKSATIKPFVSWSTRLQKTTTEEPTTDEIRFTSILPEEEQTTILYASELERVVVNNTGASSSQKLKNSKKPSIINNNISTTNSSSYIVQPNLEDLDLQNESEHTEEFSNRTNLVIENNLKKPFDSLGEDADDTKQAVNNNSSQIVHSGDDEILVDEEELMKNHSNETATILSSTVVTSFYPSTTSSSVMTSTTTVSKSTSNKEFYEVDPESNLTSVFLNDTYLNPAVHKLEDTSESDIEISYDPAALDILKFEVTSNRNSDVSEFEPDMDVISHQGHGNSNVTTPTYGKEQYFVKTTNSKNDTVVNINKLDEDEMDAEQEMNSDVAVHNQAIINSTASHRRENISVSSAMTIAPGIRTTSDDQEISSTAGRVDLRTNGSSAPEKSESIPVSVAAEKSSTLENVSESYKESSSVAAPPASSTTQDLKNGNLDENLYDFDGPDWNSNTEILENKFTLGLPTWNDTNNSIIANKTETLQNPVDKGLISTTLKNVPTEYKSNLSKIDPVDMMHHPVNSSADISQKRESMTTDVSPTTQSSSHHKISSSSILNRDFPQTTPTIESPSFGIISTTSSSGKNQSERDNVITFTVINTSTITPTKSTVHLVSVPGIFSTTPSESIPKSTTTERISIKSSKTSTKPPKKSTTASAGGGAGGGGTGFNTQNPSEIPGYLILVFKSTPTEICNSSSLIEDSLFEFITRRSYKIQSRDQITLVVDPEFCKNESNNLTKLIPTTLYILDVVGAYDRTLINELQNLLQAENTNFSSPIHEIKYQEKMLPQSSRVVLIVAVSCVAAVSMILFLFLMCMLRNKQKFGYGQRCTPVGIDDYSLDNISVYNNSTRRKSSGNYRASKRSYGNPAFHDPAGPSKPLNYAGLLKAVENRPAIDEEFSLIPTVIVRPDELPPGTEMKNRYANVIPLPETRVSLSSNPHTADSSQDYINANYVKGYKDTEKFYIACQAPLKSTIEDFWKMVWKEQSKVIIMLTALAENGVEKCSDYLPPSEVLDCHRLFGDFQVTLRKREVREKYVVSSLQLKNMENSLWREVTHIWYTSWPTKGVPNEQSSIIAMLIEARTFMRNSQGPHVIHCSPGTGRTGTIIACDICIRDFEQTRAVNIPITVSMLRRYRAGAVQTKDQYAFIYKVLALYAKKLNGGTTLDSM